MQDVEKRLFCPECFVQDSGRSWGKTAMSWDALWALALKRFGAEDIQIRILIGLAVAFLILMIIEGLRTSFRPGKRRALSPSQPPVGSALAAGPAKPVAQPFRARLAVVRATPKRAKRAVNRQRPPLPKIRRRKSSAIVRTPTFTEEAAPYSPLSPNRYRDLL